MVLEVEAKHAVPWMAPIDADESLWIGIDPEARLPHKGGMWGLFAEGNVMWLKADLPVEKRQALISIAGGGGEELGEFGQW